MKRGFDVVFFSDVSRTMGYGKYSGPYVLKTALQKRRHSAVVIDCYTRMSLDDLLEITENVIGDNTLAVGISATLLKVWSVNGEKFAHQKLTVEEADRLGKRLFFGREDVDVEELIACVRRINPKVKVVLGGSQVSTENLPRPDLFDLYFVGQADVSLPAFVDHLKHDAPFTADFHEGKPIATSQRYPFNDFNKSEIVWTEADNLEPGEAVPLEIARGCVFKCAFCAFDLTGKKFGDWTKSTETLTAELIRNYETWGTTKYLVSDDTLNDSPEKVEWLHSTITSLPFKLEITSYVRLDIINKHRWMAQALKEIGLRQAIFGIETLHQEAGSLVGKGLAKERTLDTLRHCRSVWSDQVHMGSGFIIGLPREPLESIESTFNWIMSSDCELDTAAFQALAIYYENVAKNKMFFDPTKYGYEVSGYYWKSAVMNSHQARDLAARYNALIEEKNTALTNINASVGMILRVENVLPLGTKFNDVNRRELRPWLKQLTDERVARAVEHYKTVTPPELAPSRSRVFTLKQV